MDEIRLLAALILVVSGLDFWGLLPLTWPGWSALCLGLASHWLLLGRLAGRETGWMLAAGGVYSLLRLCWKPLSAREKQRLTGQARAMLAGRRALGGGLAALCSQPFWCWVGWRSGAFSNQSWKLLLADGLLAVSAAVLPALVGSLRAILRSKRLGALKRVAALWLFWVPVVNLPVFWALYRLTGAKQPQSVRPALSAGFGPWRRLSRFEIFQLLGPHSQSVGPVWRPGVVRPSAGLGDH